MARPYLVTAGGTAVGYAGVWVEHFPGRVMEFYLRPGSRQHAMEAFEALVISSRATALEAQTNLPQIHELLERYAVHAVVEKLLFADGSHTKLRRPPGVRLSPGSDGDWRLLRGDDTVASGGYLTHYNPPYCDIYMEVVPEERGRGLGSYLVQELRRLARKDGLVPAARCDPTNEASRRTLVRGGLTECGRILSGPLSQEVRRS